MLKIRDKLGKIIAILKDDSSEPEFVRKEEKKECCGKCKCHEEKEEEKETEEE